LDYPAPSKTDNYVNARFAEMSSTIFCHCKSDLLRLASLRSTASNEVMPMALQHERAQNAINNDYDPLGGLAKNAIAPQELKPPTYGGPQRDAINSVVDGIIGDICEKVVELRKLLDQIEQQVLQSAAKSKHTLNEHVALCIKINDEVMHAREVITDLAETTREP
jgi:hypothetical protein